MYMHHIISLKENEEKIYIKQLKLINTQCDYYLKKDGLFICTSMKNGMLSVMIYYGRFFLGT